MKPHRFKIGLMITTFALITELEAKKKILDHNAYETWQFIKNYSISNDGKWITYALKKNSISDPVIKLSTFEGAEVLTVPGGKNPKFNFNSNYLFFNIQPAIHKINQLKRIKTKEENFPIDSLGIYDLDTKK